MAETPPSRFRKMVEEAKARIAECDVAEVKRRIDAGEAFHLVDVREQDEYAAGHLPGALHLSKGVIERDIEKNMADPEAVIVCYCGGGSRSALAAESLRRMGYTSVISMAGGMRDWKAAGYPVEA